MGCGIYKIENSVNNKIYIGSSIDINKRFYKHLWMLRKGIHDNIHLQNSFNQYGENSFNFSILEYCNISELVNRENFYIRTQTGRWKEFPIQYPGESLRLTEEVTRVYSQIVCGNVNRFPAHLPDYQPKKK